MMRIIILIVMILLSGCSKEPVKENENIKKDEFKVEQVSEIQKIRPEKPVKIKLKRDAQGRYSWELSGENADDIIRLDRKLRKTYNPPEAGQ